MNFSRLWKILQRMALSGAMAAAMCAGISLSAAAPTPVSISQLPLTIVVPAHPQIILAVGNSESMDGNLSGAIMAGSGSLPAADALLQNSSSPPVYPIPGGFTPPVNPGALGFAPYTVAVGANLVDNSPSRLNVAKGGITAVLNTFMANADFALVDYQTGGTSIYTTWLYEMSPTGSGFVFTNTQIAGNRYVQNPCQNYNLLLPANVIYQNCHAMDTSGQVTGNMATSQYMQISASSDDPLINDVLYANGGIAPVCLVYGGPNPPNPWPPHYTLGQYNANPGIIQEGYTHQINACAGTTTPTNAGFVPYTPQTMYIQRGFGYGGGQAANNGNTLVGMTSAGQYPTTATVNAAIAQFTQYLQPETNNPGTSEIKASGGQSALPGLLQGAKNLFNTNPPTTNGCAAQRYVVLLTDGLPTLDLAGHSWPPPGTTSATNYGANVAFNGDGSLNVPGTNHQAVLDTISKLASLNSGATPIKTYIIGLGAGVDPTVNPTAASVLTAMAIAGGTGTYFAATSPTALTADLQVILGTILAATQSTAAASVNSTELQNGSYAYLAQFTTSDANQDWTGDVHEFPIDPITGQVNTGVGAAVWSAKTQLDAQNWNAGRNIATWDPVANAGTPFRWNPALAPAGISATTTLGMQLSTFTADTNGQDILQFLRGSNAQEVRFGGQLRNRTHKLGDIVDSAPQFVGTPAGFSELNSYKTFIQTYKNRETMLYVGANDGMLHGLDATTGNEMFAYIPNGVFSNLVKLANPFYNSNHLMFVDGTPQIADVQFSDSSWHTVLVGGESAGGTTLYALDVTDPTTFATENGVAQDALWEFSDPDMGYSYSAPAFGMTRVNATPTYQGWLIFVGNGYDSAQQKPFLYALNPQTGAIVTKIDLCAQVAGVCNLGLTNGLSSVTVVNSYGQNSAPADTVYAGDLQGNMWRVDITSATPASWTVKVIFQARDSGNNPQPITTAPVVGLNPLFPGLLGDMVEFGTGQLLGVPDLTTSGMQSLYGIYDAPTAAAPPTGFAGIPTRGANLVQQSTSASTAAGLPVLIESTVNPVNLPVNRGWYVDLNAAVGMRMVTNPIIETGGVFVTTEYQPNTNPCVGGGNAWLYAMNYATGGAFRLPELDLNGDGQLNSGDQTAGGANPIAVSLGSGFASAVTLTQSKCTGNACNNKHVGRSNVTVATVNDRGGGKQRVGWWEVRH